MSYGVLPIERKWHSESTAYNPDTADGDTCLPVVEMFVEGVNDPHHTVETDHSQGEHTHHHQRY